MRRVLIVVLLAASAASTGMAKAAASPAPELFDRAGGAQYRAFD